MVIRCDPQPLFEARCSSGSTVGISASSGGWEKSRVVSVSVAWLFCLLGGGLRKGWCWWLFWNGLWWYGFWCQLWYWWLFIMLFEWVVMVWVLVPGVVLVALVEWVVARWVVLHRVVAVWALVVVVLLLLVFWVAAHLGRVLWDLLVCPWLVQW